MSDTAPQQSAFERWYHQPSTITGIGIIVAAVAGLLTHAATGNPTYDAVLAAIGMALPHLLIQDNTAAPVVPTTAPAPGAAP